MNSFDLSKYKNILAIQVKAFISINSEVHPW